MENLKAKYLELLGSKTLEEISSSSPEAQESNELLGYTKDSNKHRCRYLLSGSFDRCGIPTDNIQHENLSIVMASAMDNAFYLIDRYGATDFNEKILVGLSPYNSFGAEVVRENDGYLILISPSTLSFCFIYSILAITSMQAVAHIKQSSSADYSKPELLEKLKSQENGDFIYNSLEAIKLFINEFTDSETIKNPPALVKLSGLEKLHPDYLERIQTTYEHFTTILILHEFSHIYLGHLRAASSTNKTKNPEHTECCTPQTAPRQEEDADDLAIRIFIGKEYQPEMLQIVSALENGDTNHPDLRRLWTGHNAYGRYVSAMLLLKAFDLFDNLNVRNPETGIAFSDNCEINHSHPSGQHRFIRAYCKLNEILSMPEGKELSLNPVLEWANWVTISIFSSHNKESTT